MTTGRDKEWDLEQSPCHKADTVVWTIQKKPQKRKREEKSKEVKIKQLMLWK